MGEREELDRLDLELHGRLRAGDPYAFEELYRLHAGRVYNLACRLSGNQSDGEDLLQEIFVLVFRKLESFKGEAALGTWIYRLATNHCLDFLRSRDARMRQVTGTLGYEDVKMPAPVRPLRAARWVPRRVRAPRRRGVRAP